MKAFELEIIKVEVKSIIQDICNYLEVNEVVSDSFIPGNFIMSNVLVSIFPQIEIKTGINIPLDCYIFHDSKLKNQLNINEAVSKLLKLAKNKK